MINNDLQKKLENFAGFKEVYFKEPPYEVAWVEDKDGHMFTDGIPDLINDLNAQRKYLYPLIYNLPESVYGDTSIQMEWVAEYKKWSVFIDLLETYEASDVDLAVAFALACDKMINGLAKNSVKEDRLKDEVKQSLIDSKNHPELFITSEEMEKRLNENG